MPPRSPPRGRPHRRRPRPRPGSRPGPRRGRWRAAASSRASAGWRRTASPGATFSMQARRFGVAVDLDQAVLADAHAAEDRAQAPAGGLTKRPLTGRDQRRRQRLAGPGRDPPPLEGEGHLAACPPHPRPIPTSPSTRVLAWRTVGRSCGHVKRRNAHGVRSCEGRRAVVTGASRGLGRAIADRFAAEGAAVWVVDLPDALDPSQKAAGTLGVDLADPGAETALADPGRRARHGRRGGRQRRRGAALARRRGPGSGRMGPGVRGQRLGRCGAAQDLRRGARGFGPGSGGADGLDQRLPGPSRPDRLHRQQARGGRPDPGGRPRPRPPRHPRQRASPPARSRPRR